ncbi:hypothetical protein [Bacillus toyonensis]
MNYEKDRYKINFRELKLCKYFILNSQQVHAFFVKYNHNWKGVVALVKYKSYIATGCISIGILVTGTIGWNGKTEAIQVNKNASSFEVKEHDQGIHWIYDLYGIENQIGFIKQPIVVNQSKT